MISILHLSDPHFGTVSEHVCQALERFVDECKPDVILLSGDITQRARRNQFIDARAFVDRLSAPILIVPGNHDIPLFNVWARLTNPYGNYRAVFGDDLEPELETESLLIISVNTTRAARHKDGEISAEQTARVAQRLERASPEQLRVVMQHHPVRAAVEHDVSNLALGREIAIPAWVDAGLDLLVVGHVHLPFIGELKGSVDNTAWTVQAGTAMSSRTRGLIPNSFNVIRYQSSAHGTQSASASGRDFFVERWDYADLESRFVQTGSTHLSHDSHPA